jgi:signal transduction histidine kinase/type II secretory pathway pseudopilin PulG
LLILVAAMSITLVVLAALQYRWSGQISEAELTRMQSNLATSINQFRNDYHLELQRICMAAQLDFSEYSDRDWRRLALHLKNWLQTPANARLISNIFIWNVPAGEPMQLLRLDLQTDAFEKVSWPERLASLRNSPRWADSERMPPMPRTNVWTMIEDLSLLIHPLQRFLPREEGINRMPPSLGYLMIEMNQEALLRELLPELAQRHFGNEKGFIYQVAVVSEAHPEKVLFQSESSLSSNLLTAPDARASLLLSQRSFFNRPPDNGPPPAGRSAPGPGGARQRQPPGQPGAFSPRQERGRNLAVIVPSSEGSGWVLLVQHQGGTLADVVASQRRRNLTIGFGILLLLAISMAMILISTQRARRLARLQMEFVAGVSHELRTPLSVICSAGDNLAAGIVANSTEKTRQYGELIRREGRRLTAMVEQILHFAAIQAGSRQYHLRIEQVDEIVESTLTRLQPMIDFAGFTLDRQLQPDLPPARVDRSTLSQCIENLIDNALKYGGAERCVHVLTRCVPGEGKREIQIAVEDQGNGIEPEDLEHIFEPFYRGKTATDEQIHGSGLGLSLAQEGARAMGGRISAKSKRGSGSSFTIHIPVMAHGDSAPGQNGTE